MDGSLGSDLDLRMDQLAHRRRVARAEGGQEAARKLSRIQLPTAQGLGQALRLVAEAGLSDGAKDDADHSKREQNPGPDAELERMRGLRVEVQPRDHDVVRAKSTKLTNKKDFDVVWKAP